MDSYDLVILGAGPGGYVAAIRAAQLGLRVALVEKSNTLGGTCLNVGCIPSKALLESSYLYRQATSNLAEHGVLVDKVALDLGNMMQRKQNVVSQLTDGIALLMKKNKITVYTGQGQLLRNERIRIVSNKDSLEIKADSILLATGSQVIELEQLPFDGKLIVSSTEALSFEQVPKHLLVVGAGAVGLELGTVWQRLGARVSVVELLGQIVPFADVQIARMLQRHLKAQGMDFYLKTKVVGAHAQNGILQAELFGPKNEKSTLECDKILVCVGRKPAISQLDLDQVGVSLDEAGRISVDADFKTSVDNIYAIGDLIKGPMLAHKAEEEGMAVAEKLAGLPGLVQHDLIPSVVYSAPELAQVGITESQAKQQQLDFKIGKFSFRANGRAICSGETDGMVRIVADANTDRLLGVHILGPHASELIAEAVLAMEFGASSEDIARTIHAHPTLSEAFREAALDVDKRAIHA